MKLILVVASLRLGGAERVAAVMASFFAQSGYDVTVVTRTDTDDFYTLPQSVKRIRLNSLRASRSPMGAFFRNRQLVGSYRRVFKQEKPDLIISYMNRTNVRVLMAASPLGIPVIATEHNYPPANPQGRIWEKLRRRWYPRVACLVSLSRGTDACFNYLPQEQREVINNPVASNQPYESIKRTHRERHSFISAGRLMPVKDYPFLIRCFGELADKLPEWDLVILGEGSERERLEAQIQKQGLEGRVILPGKVTNIQERFAAADIFCLTSKTEGFGNVLIEAMAAGLPVLSVDCPTGPAELIRSEKEGILVPLKDQDAYIRAMSDLAGNKDKREALSIAGRKRAADFTPEKIMPQWDTLLNRIISS